MLRTIGLSIVHILIGIIYCSAINIVIEIHLSCSSAAWLQGKWTADSNSMDKKKIVGELWNIHIFIPFRPY